MYLNLHFIDNVDILCTVIKQDGKSNQSWLLIWRSYFITWVWRWSEDFRCLGCCKFEYVHQHQIWFWIWLIGAENTELCPTLSVYCPVSSVRNMWPDNVVVKGFSPLISTGLHKDKPFCAKSQVQSLILFLYFFYCQLKRLVIDKMVDNAHAHRCYLLHICMC